MTVVMKVLKQASLGLRQPDFFGRHPNLENRFEQAIQTQFPNGCLLD